MAEEEKGVVRQHWLSRVFRSVSLRLFLILFGVVSAVFALQAYVNLRSASREWSAVLEQSASRTSELIKSGTHYGMLLNRKDEVHQNIIRIAQAPGVAGVRIYDKQGTIIFSADPAEIGRRVDMQAEACVVCHDRSAPLRSVPASNRVRIYLSPSGSRVLGVISSINNQSECSSAPCHAHSPSQTVLGVLDVMMSLEGADQQLADMKRQTVLWTLLMVGIVGLTTAIFIYRVVRVPVSRLIAGTERVARGDLDTRIHIGTRNQIGLLAESFNRMTEDLGRARKELTEWSEKLERKVVEKTEELGQAHRQIVHMEKMASLGKLSATVAHELNNPLAGILNYSKLVGRCLQDDGPTSDERPEVMRYLDLIQKESRRCGDIVRNLLLFARPAGGEFALQHVNPILERAAMLVHHHTQIAGIRMETEPLAGDDQVVCDADQLQQALVALLVNAVEAMPHGGSLMLKGEADDGVVRISVTDTGVGMSPEVQARIFEPFFSTKDGKTGVGLGLAVVYGIVQRHGGRIDVESAVGRGTTFTVRLPRQPGPGLAERRPAAGAS